MTPGTTGSLGNCTKFDQPFIEIFAIQQATLNLIVSLDLRLLWPCKVLCRYINSIEKESSPNFKQSDH